MRIAHVVNTASGAPWMLALAREQKLRGHDVLALIPSLDGSLAGALAEVGVEVHVAPVDILRGANGVLGRIGAMLRFVRVLRRLRPDVVHSHIAFAVITTRIASWLADVPAHFGGNVHPISLESELLRVLEMGTAFCDARTIASSSYTHELYLRYGLPPKQLALQFYAVDQSKHHPAPDGGIRVRQELGLSLESPVVGMVAYFYPPARTRLIVPAALFDRGIKAHDVLLRSIPAVLRSVPEARFVLVGKGWGPEGDEYVRSLQELVASLGVGHAVLFAGERSDVPEMLAAFDVAVQCSLSDNLGGTVESLLMERPTVVSDAGGFRDTVLHEETGLVVPKDDPEALAAAIVRLLRDPELGRRLAKAGRERMLAGFQLEHTVEGVEELLRQTHVRAADFYRLRVTIGRLLLAPFRFLPTTMRTVLTVLRAR
jgi:glycosyltransferase involved in cell wall biosynthesis